MNPLSSRNTDLMKRDLVQMLRSPRVGNTKYAIIDANRRVSDAKAPTAKGAKIPGAELRKPDRLAPPSGRLRKIFG